MKPELDAVALNDKTARSGKKCMFHFPRLYIFAECEMEFPGCPQVLQPFRIRHERRDAVRCDISINNRIDQRRPEVNPMFVPARFARKPRY